MKTLIFGGTVVNEGVARKASVIVDNDVITEIVEGTDSPRGNYDSVVDATGCFVLPGVIDDHVHFRDPGLTQRQTSKRKVVQLHLAVSRPISICPTPIRRPQRSRHSTTSMPTQHASRTSTMASSSVPPTTHRCSYVDRPAPRAWYKAVYGFKHRQYACRP